MLARERKIQSRVFAGFVELPLPANTRTPTRKVLTRLTRSHARMHSLAHSPTRSHAPTQSCAAHGAVCRSASLDRRGWWWWFCNRERGSVTKCGSITMRGVEHHGPIGVGAWLPSPWLRRHARLHHHGFTSPWLHHRGYITVAATSPCGYAWFCNLTRFRLRGARLVPGPPPPPMPPGTFAVLRRHSMLNPKRHLN